VEGRDYWDCPTCHRPHKRTRSGELTYRWPHPVSLPLYAVLFDDDPLPRVEEVARQLRGQRSAADFKAVLDEIELELVLPTQQCRAILRNPQAEKVCRQFLREVVTWARDQK